MRGGVETDRGGRVRQRQNGVGRGPLGWRGGRVHARGKQGLGRVLGWWAVAEGSTGCRAGETSVCEHAARSAALVRRRGRRGQAQASLPRGQEPASQQTSSWCYAAVTAGQAAHQEATDAALVPDEAEDAHVDKLRGQAEMWV